MEITTKYTYRSLVKNKTRTFVTILGIIVSVAMFTAVTEAIASARSFLINYYKETTGAYHVMIYNLPKDRIDSVKNYQNISESTLMYNVGYGKIKSENEFKPYLHIASVSEDITDYLSVDITEGRLPENSCEIMLPNHLLTNGNVIMKLGDRFEIEVGTRTLDGQSLTQSTEFKDGESLKNTKRKTYTVVGFFDRPNYSIEPYSAPGYTALTSQESSDSATMFVKFGNVYKSYSTIEELSNTALVLDVHRTLLVMYGVAGSNAVNELIFGFCAILFSLIMFGSVSLIYNAFSISVSERTKQFGILKSVGATKKQIRKTVVKEALMLCAVAVPAGLVCGCVGIGITLYFLKDSFYGFIGNYTDIEMKLVLSPVALIFAAVISIVTTLISAYIPAKRAVSIPALEAVRQSGDVAIKNYKNKNYHFTKKLFGVEGMIGAKNFRRNKRRYRAAVLSLFMSVVLFISASSFCAYLVDAAGTMPADSGEDVVLSYGDNVKMTDELYNLILSESESDACATMNYRYVDAFVKKDLLTDYYTDEYLKADEAEYPISFDVICVDEKTYYDFAKQNGIKASGNAILYDNSRSFNGEGKLFTFDVFKNDLESLTFTENGEQITYKIDGYTDTMAWFGTDNPRMLIFPDSKQKELLFEYEDYSFYFLAKDHRACHSALERIMKNAGYENGRDYFMMDMAEELASTRAMITVITVFAYGFIILISLIALANVFNTITTNIYLRRRELAMLRSVGMSKRGFNKMMNYECIVCGLRGLGYGIPAAFVFTLLIYLVTTNGYVSDFFIPWTSIAIAVLSVFAIVFVAMFYSMHKLSKENTIDTLRNENI